MRSTSNRAWTRSKRPGIASRATSCDVAAIAAIARAAKAGRADEALFSRCRLYGAVDDVMAGLWGVVRAAASPRTGIEFYKYGTWRLFHARVTTADRAFEAWLRQV